MPAEGQYYGQYDYEWMDATAQFGKLLDDLFPTLEEYGLIDWVRQSPEPLPSPTIVVQPAPTWYEQLPSWAWAALGIGGGAMLALLLRR